MKMEESGERRKKGGEKYQRETTQRSPSLKEA
jgi:hypothetical protein